MKIIQEAIALVATVLAPQKTEENTLYRKISFCVRAVAEDVQLAYNSLTGEVVSLSEREAEILDGAPTLPTEESIPLIEKRFLVPVEHDDIQLADEILELAKVFKKKKGISSYTIFTTLDCNARCFYCYEMGRPRTPMSVETAKATAEFIKSNCSEKKKAKIYWFGGEPLCNTEVIDIISNALAEAGIEFSAQITSNGYLFDEETVKKASNDWKVKLVQITLDGTEEVYNRAKAYVDSKGKNPFKIVTDNIETLLKYGVKVNVRVNIGEHNLDDLYNLVDFIAERYKGYEGLGVYSHLLFETEENRISEETMISLAKEQLKFEESLIEKGLAKQKTVRTSVITNYCMADSDASITVTPNGSLGKCEHYSEDEYVGSLKDGVTDYAKVAEFAKRGNTREYCEGCSAYPVCIRLKKCPDKGVAICNSGNRLLTETRLRRQAVQTYLQKQN